MKKKLISLALVVGMFITILSGCGQSSSDSSENSDEISGEADASNSSDEISEETDVADEISQNNESRKMGVILYGKDDTMGAAVYSYLNFAAEALNVNITWAFGDYDAAAQLTTCQNMVAAGCEGILMLPMDDAAVQQVSAYCEQNEVYFGIMFRDITDDTIKEMVEGYNYYVVDSFGDQSVYAQRMIEYMSSEYGVSNFGQMSLYASSPLVSRNDGFEAGYEATSTTKLAEFSFPTDSNTQTIAAGIENLVNSYPDMDAIALCASSIGAGETVMNTLKTMTEPGAIKVGTFDTFEGMEAAFESGYLVYVAGGDGIESLFDFCVLYNAVDGTPLSDGTVIFKTTQIEVKSYEDSISYSKYINNPNYQLFTKEEIQGMCKRYNEEASVELVNDYVNNFTLEWVIERSGE